MAFLRMAWWPRRHILPEVGSVTSHKCEIRIGEASGLREVLVKSLHGFRDFLELLIVENDRAMIKIDSTSLVLRSFKLLRHRTICQRRSQVESISYLSSIPLRKRSMPRRFDFRIDEWPSCKVQYLFFVNLQRRHSIAFPPYRISFSELLEIHLENLLSLLLVE